MDFMEAVQAMKEGKQIQRGHWKFLGYKSSNDSLVFKWEDGSKYELQIIDIEATDWKIVGEKKTLSDKIEGLFIEGLSDARKLKVSDVKKSMLDILFKAKIAANDTDEDRERIDYESLKVIFKEELGEQLTPGGKT
jgi:phosphopentomutase